MRRHPAAVRPIGTAFASGAVLAVATLVHAQGFAPADAPVLAVETCIGQERLELHAGLDSALLDDSDREHVQAAMLARYPAFGRDGAATSAIVLWRRPDASWVYLALKAHPDKPGKLCSAASFAAGVFEFSPGLQHKYFFAKRS
ncbi:MAG: hypothetical protein KF788_03040 [Piscinibacter sp.]|nr:hypothetical protein [Piscinibacter sp.]